MMDITNDRFALDDDKKRRYGDLPARRCLKQTFRTVICIVTLY